MHVLHDCRISEEEMIVLSLGLNFCPPPRKPKSILLSDAEANFTRQVRITHFAALQLDNSTRDTGSSTHYQTCTNTN